MAPQEEPERKPPTGHGLPTSYCNYIYFPRMATSLSGSSLSMDAQVRTFCRAPEPHRPTVATTRNVNSDSSMEAP